MIINEKKKRDLTIGRNLSLLLSIDDPFDNFLFSKQRIFSFLFFKLALIRSFLVEMNASSLDAKERVKSFPELSS